MLHVGIGDGGRAHAGQGQRATPDRLRSVFVDAIRTVRRHEILRFPRRERERDGKDVGVGDRVGIDPFPAHDALVGAQRRHGAGRQVRRELGPRVRARRDLGDRTEREPARVFGDGQRRELRRGVEREPILGVTRGRPQLPAGLEGTAGAITQRHQRIPVTGGTKRVDEPQQLVEIVGVDRGADRVGHDARRLLGKEQRHDALVDDGSAVEVGPAASGSR